MWTSIIITFPHYSNIRALYRHNLLDHKYVTNACAFMKYNNYIVWIASQNFIYILSFLSMLVYARTSVYLYMTLWLVSNQWLFNIFIILCSIIKVLWSEISKEVFIALMTETDKYGNTPLHLCCKYGHIAVIRKIMAILKVDGVLQKANRSLCTM